MIPQPINRCQDLEVHVVRDIGNEAELRPMGVPLAYDVGVEHLFSRSVPFADLDVIPGQEEFELGFCDLHEVSQAGWRLTKVKFCCCCL